MSQLSKLLKKNDHLWGPLQTKVVQELKNITQDPPLLKIPYNGQRILQRYTSDEYWGGVVLFESTDGKKYLCGHMTSESFCLMSTIINLETWTCNIIY